MLSSACRHGPGSLYAHRLAAPAVWVVHCTLGRPAPVSFPASFSVLDMRDAGQAGELYEDVQYSTAYPYASLDYGQSFITVSVTEPCAAFRGASACTGPPPAKLISSIQLGPPPSETIISFGHPACRKVACPYCHQCQCSNRFCALKRCMSIPCCALSCGIQRLVDS